MLVNFFGLSVWVPAKSCLTCVQVQVWVSHSAKNPVRFQSVLWRNDFLELRIGRKCSSILSSYKAGYINKLSTQKNLSKKACGFQNPAGLWRWVAQSKTRWFCRPLGLKNNKRKAMFGKMLSVCRMCYVPLRFSIAPAR